MNSTQYSNSSTNQKKPNSDSARTRLERIAAEKVGQVNFSEYSFATFFTTGGTVAHQQGHLRLLNPKDLNDLCLRQAAVLEDRMNLQCEFRLKQLLLGIGKAEGPEDVSATFSYAGDSLACFSRFWLSVRCSAICGCRRRGRLGRQTWPVPKGSQIRGGVGGGLGDMLRRAEQATQAERRRACRSQRVP